MKKLFQTLCVLLTLSTQASVASAKLNQEFDADFLSFKQTNRSASYSKDLEGLYGIKTFQSGYIKQPYSEFNQLYQNAIAGQKELEGIAEKIAQQSNTSMLSSGVKSKLRAIDKINIELDGKSEQIMDLARTSIVAKDVPSLMAAFELFDKKTQLMRIKNRFKAPGASGYRDLNLLVRLPKSNIIAEVQLHLEAFSEIKNGQEHQNYEQIQAIERLQLTDNRTLSEIEQAAINKLRKQSQKMYKAAWNQYLTA